MRMIQGDNKNSSNALLRQRHSVGLEMYDDYNTCVLPSNIQYHDRLGPQTDRQTEIIVRIAVPWMEMRHLHSSLLPTLEF